MNTVNTHVGFLSVQSDDYTLRFNENGRLHNIPIQFARDLLDSGVGVQNIIQAYHASSKRQCVRGAGWYAEAQSYAAYFAKTYGSTAGRFADVIGITSSRTPWDRNIIYTAMIGRHWAEGTDPSQTTMFCTYKNRRLAMDVLSETAKVKGIKKTNFRGAIMHPDSPAFCAVDIHAMGLFCGYPLSSRCTFSDSCYAAAESAYRSAAGQLFIKATSILQAITWLFWRETVLGNAVSPCLSPENVVAYVAELW